jgi:hypothetical protein
MMADTDYLTAWKTDDAARERAAQNWDTILRRKANEIVLGTGMTFEDALTEAKKRLLAGS